MKRAETMDIHTPERKIKLIWDFRGPQAEVTARHHAYHLEEFTAAKALTLNLNGSEKISDMHCIAYMVVFESEMPEVRDALKPHRGQLYAD